MDEEHGEARKRRIAHNEVVFREVNERVKEISADAPTDELGLLCECGRPTCTEAIRMQSEAYEALRANPLHFAVRPGHEIDDVERVVAERDDYRVVMKIEVGARVAREADPRS
jgi:hypothetical protein